MLGNKIERYEQPIKYLDMMKHNANHIVPLRILRAQFATFMGLYSKKIFFLENYEMKHFFPFLFLV